MQSIRLSLAACKAKLPSLSTVRPAQSWIFWKEPPCFLFQYEDRWRCTRFWLSLKEQGGKILPLKSWLPLSYCTSYSCQTLGVCLLCKCATLLLSGLESPLAGTARVERKGLHARGALTAVSPLSASPLALLHHVACPLYDRRGKKSCFVFFQCFKKSSSHLLLSVMCV